MTHCYICDRSMTASPVNYPDGKNPCPECVEAYREYKKIDEQGELFPDEEDEAVMEKLEIYNLPSDVEDYYDE